MNLHRKSKQTGFSLVEVMVGVLIAMIGIVVIFQVLATAEERKRTTSSGSDAQISAAIALYSLERDLRQGGFGFSLASLQNYMGCSVSASDSSRPTAAFTFTLAPVQITQGASGAPDTITVLYGNSPMFAATQTFSLSTTTTKTTQGAGGMRLNDRMFVASAGPTCGMIEVTAEPPVGSTVVTHGASRYNPAGGALIAAQGHVYNMGNSPRRNIWMIRSGKTLTVSNDLVYADANGDGANDWIEIGENIINLQAEYGVDANGDNMISAAEWTTTDPAGANWSRVRAVRVALLARSGQYERNMVPNYATCATTVGSDPVTCQRPSWAGGGFTITNVDGTADSNPGDANNWRNYRYRVYETVIPLRNMIWGTIP